MFIHRCPPWARKWNLKFFWAANEERFAAYRAEERRLSFLSLINRCKQSGGIFSIEIGRILRITLYVGYGFLRVTGRAFFE